MDMKWFDDMEARIPKGKVRTRFDNFIASIYIKQMN